MARTWLLMLAIVAGLVLSCSGGSDANDIAKSLEDRLIDALAFEGGTTREGLPPEGSNAAEAPQISEIKGNDQRLGGSVGFLLFSDFEQTDTVKKAIVFVKGATRYFEVDGNLYEGLLLLSGHLGEDSYLQGKNFELEFALQTSDGKTGLYKMLSLTVLNEEATKKDPLACTWTCEPSCSSDQICAPVYGPEGGLQCTSSCPGNGRATVPQISMFGSEECARSWALTSCRYRCGLVPSQILVDYLWECLSASNSPNLDWSEKYQAAKNICGLIEESVLTPGMASGCDI